jgi:23S rRNA (pseudouridine1915-N3)-methyltransferase
MKFKILSIGQKMPKWVSLGFEEYTKRMPRECSVDVVELPVGKRSKQSDIQRVIEDEGKRLLDKIKPSDFVVALEITGKQWSTAGLAQKLQSWQGIHQHIIVLIGGPDGLSDTCLKRANDTWCLSELTFPHPLVRVILAEQLYRGWSLMNNHPYHRE